MQEKHIHSSSCSVPQFPTCGRTAKAYFYNPVTKDSSWTRPPPKPPPPPPAPVKPKMDPVKAAGLIPGTKDPEDWHLELE